MGIESSSCVWWQNTGQELTQIDGNLPGSALLEKGKVALRTPHTILGPDSKERLCLSSV